MFVVHVELAGARVAVECLDDTNGLIPVEAKSLQPGDVLPMHGLELGGCTTAVFKGLEPMPPAFELMRTVLPLNAHLGRVVLGASVIGELSDGSPVYMQHSHSHAITHFQADPDLHRTVPVALARIAPPHEQRHTVEVTFAKRVGWSELVEVEPDDPRVFYATRPNRTVPIPFVEGREMEPSRSVTLHLTTVAAAQPSDGLLGCYELFSAYTGERTPPLPNTTEGQRDPKSIPFWSKHALVPRQPYDPATRTSVRPW